MKNLAHFPRLMAKGTHGDVMEKVPSYCTTKVSLPLLFPAVFATCWHKIHP